MACEDSRRLGGGGSTPVTPRPDAQPQGDATLEPGQDAQAAEDGGAQSSQDTGALDAGEGRDALGARDVVIFDAVTFDASEARDAVTFDAVTFDAAPVDVGFGSPDAAPTGQCASLAVCCGQIPVSSIAAQCNSTASGGDESACAGLLSNIQSLVGVCGAGDGGVPRDAGAPRDSGVRDSGPAADASISAACADLALCCLSTADPVQCEAIATAGIDLICSLFAAQLGCI
jgi:hypothetical protein